MPIAVILPESPQDGGESGHPIPRWMLIASVVLVLLSAAIYSVIYVQGSGFENLFKGFGADLPLLTRVVLASYKWYGVLALVGAVPSYYLFKNRFCYIGDRNSLFVPVIVSFSLAVFILVVVTMAMYLPVFQVGSVIQ